MLYIFFINPVNGFSWNNVLNQLGYFSLISSLLVTLTFILLFISQLSGHKKVYPKPVYRGAALLYAGVSSLIFIVFYYDLFDTQGFQSVVYYFVHIFFSLFLLVDNILTLPPKVYTYNMMIYWLVFPFFYLIFLFIESYLLNKQHYDFLAFNAQNLSFSFITILLVTGVFLAVSLVIIFINRTKDVLGKNEEDEDKL